MTALSPTVFTLTICQFLRLKSLASATLRWICLCATMSPWLSCISPFGPLIVIAQLPSKSQDSLMGACTPSLYVSDWRISTCVNFLNGHKILTPLISPFGPLIVSVSSQANCPGWDSFFISLKGYPVPKSVLASASDKWMWRFEMLIGILTMGMKWLLINLVGLFYNLKLNFVSTKPDIVGDPRR